MVWFWLIISGLSLVIEIFTQSLVSIWFVGAGLVAALIALIGLPMYSQILAFVAASILLFGYVKNWMETHVMLPGDKYPTNADRLIGRVGRVTQTIRPYEGGRVEVEGMDWKAIGNHNETIVVGTPIEIVKISGVKLEVIELPEEEILNEHSD